MIKCSVCNVEALPSAKFCSSCGTPLFGGGDTTTTIPPILEEIKAHDLNPDDLADLVQLPNNSAFLFVLRGPDTGARYLIDQDLVTAGRHPRSDIFLDDVTVSRRHASFARHSDNIWISDQGSLNGTYVNRTLIDGEVALRAGDEVQIGKFRMVFYSGQS